MEKQNKTVRQKRKKEETARIRTLVGECVSLYTPTHCITHTNISLDTAYALDPRIRRFKEEEKAEREARKRAKAEAAKLEAEEKERVGLMVIGVCHVTVM